MARPPCGAAGDPVDTVAHLDEQFVRAFRRVRRGSTRVLAPFGITGAQARMLRALGRTGAPMRVGELACELEIVPRSATTMVDALEAASFVERRADEDDRRSVLVALTSAGRDLLAEMAAARHASAQSVFGRLDAGQQDELLALLAVLNADDGPDDRGGRS
jgi:DNA-binding MarR family transcriptional regulator